MMLKVSLIYHSGNSIGLIINNQDGDILQLGVDYQGGTEDMFKCIKMRVEVGREWQRGANEFKLVPRVYLNDGYS